MAVGSTAFFLYREKEWGSHPHNFPAWLLYINQQATSWHHLEEDVPTVFNHNNSPCPIHHVQAINHGE